MLLRVLVPVILVLVVGLGGLTYYASQSGAFSSPGVGTTSTVNSASGLAAYDCAAPALDTQKFCDQLPVGYQIAPKLPNAPPAFCLVGTTNSACNLLKQTWANGVCDPNETPWTDPLDCGCSGAIVGDPFTGRCGTPATVCQLQALQQAVASRPGNG